MQHFHSISFQDLKQLHWNSITSTSFVHSDASNAPLTLHSRMSRCRWVITPLWLFGSWRSFLYSSVYSCHLFFISSVSVRSIPFLSFIMPVFAWNVPLVSLIFLKRSLVFPVLLFSSISLHGSFRKAFFSFFFFLVFYFLNFKIFNSYMLSQPWTPLPPPSP